MADRAPLGFKHEYVPITSNCPPIYSPRFTMNHNISTAKFGSGFYWRHWGSGQSVPPSAIRGGTDCDGTPIYVARAHHEGDLLPAKLIPDKNVAYIAYSGNEVALYQCEVLCQSHIQWIPSGNGAVPPGAVPVGHTADGETLYAARVFHEGSHTVGKVHPSHGSCYIPFGGREIPYHQYEILVMSENLY